MKINKKHQEEEDKQTLEIEEAVESFVVPENELRIFRYQFILNYMSKPTTREKISFVKSCYGLTIKWDDIV